MVIEGLENNIYNAYGVFTKENTLVSYIDYKYKEDKVHIGVCYTVDNYRGQHLMKHLFYMIMLLYPNKYYYLTTYDSNINMIYCLEDIGYKKYKQEQDRIDNTFSLYYDYDLRK